jgi:hypothetical protein
MPVNANDREKIAHLNAERLLGLGQNPPLRSGASEATSANDAWAISATAKMLVETAGQRGDFLILANSSA